MKRELLIFSSALGLVWLLVAFGVLQADGVSSESWNWEGFGVCVVFATAMGLLALLTLADIIGQARRIRGLSKLLTGEQGPPIEGCHSLWSLFWMGDGERRRTLDTLEKLTAQAAAAPREGPEALAGEAARVRAYQRHLLLELVKTSALQEKIDREFGQNLDASLRDEELKAEIQRLASVIWDPTVVWGEPERKSFLDDLERAQVLLRDFGQEERWRSEAVSRLNGVRRQLEALIAWKRSSLN
ncbi:MAG: hypothetical protein V1821_01390 [bacterium]